jgi:nucleotide-binding universal stress UspA family protein
MKRLLANSAVRAQRVASVGDAATEILAAAGRLGEDVIVAGRRRGRAAHRHGFLSSRLACAATCDVLVVHETDGEQAATRSPS